MSDPANAYVMPGTSYFDMVPAAGGKPYRIFLSVPDEAPPPQGWPLLVTTDGNAMFPFAVASLGTQAPYPSATNTGFGVIAAIGYPGEAYYDGMRRSWDLSPPPGTSYPPYVEGGPPILTGGADGLLRFIEAELLPKLAEIATINPARRTLFGHSFGGLFTLYALFNRPDLFRTWIAASPTIHWEEQVLLKSEAARRKASGAGTFVHFSAGEYEGDRLAPFQEKNEDAARRRESKKTEQTELLARQMAARLDGSDDGIKTEFELFAGETHMSVLPSIVNRAVGIAFALRR